MTFWQCLYLLREVSLQVCSAYIYVIYVIYMTPSGVHSLHCGCEQFRFSSGTV